MHGFCTLETLYVAAQCVVGVAAREIGGRVVRIACRFGRPFVAVVGGFGDMGNGCWLRAVKGQAGGCCAESQQGSESAGEHGGD